MSDARTAITTTTIGRESVVTAMCSDTGLSATCGRYPGIFRNRKAALEELDKMRALLDAVNAVEGSSA